MTLEVQNFSTLDSAAVAQIEAKLLALLQEYNPSLELRGGALYDLLLHPGAVCATAVQVNIDRVRQSGSLLQLNADPTLADDDLTDAVLANYNLTRSAGTKAAGNLIVVLDRAVAVVLSAGLAFTVNDAEFEVPATFTTRTSPAEVLTDTDLLLTQLSASEYACTLPVTAREVGSAGNVARGASASPSPEPSYFVRAYVKSDFTGGTDAETTAQLLSRLAAGAAAKTWAGRLNIEGLLRGQTAFKDVRGLSIIGFGDAEMRRDRHALWPGAVGGRIDLYLRSQPLYQNLTVVKEATLISKVGAVGTWQVGFGLDDAPGFYQTDRILLPEQAPTDPGFAPASDTRALDLISPPLPPPDLADVVEGAYSRYQTAVVQFVDNVTDASALLIGATKTYHVVVRCMPLIAEVQDFLNDRANRPPAGDVLVKAPIPCYVGMSLTVNYRKGTVAPTAASVRKAITDLVNSATFPGKLAGSSVSQALHGLFSNLVSVTGLNMTGSIRRPDGTLAAIADSQELAVPDDPANMVTGRTTAFFLRPEDVAVTLTAVDVPAV